MKQWVAQWLPQSGIGIEFQQGTLRASYCKRSWRGFREVDGLEIPGYEQAGPQECGRLYREFLRRHRLKAPWTVVALPRAQVLLRVLKFPAAMEKDLAQAVELQLESLHPFADGAVMWDLMKWNVDRPPQNKSTNGTPAGSRDVRVLVAVAKRQYVEGRADWFREAGIPVSQFTVSTALLLEFLHGEIASRTRAGKRYFLLAESDEGFELVGCGPDGGVISREIALGEFQRDEDEVMQVLRNEVERATSELRLEPEEKLSIHHCGAGILPATAWQSAQLPFEVIPGEAGASRPEGMLSVAAGYAATHSNFPTMNLLPPELRSYEPPLGTVPTYALSCVVVLLAIATALQGNVLDWRYSRYLDGERQALMPRIQEVEKLKQMNQRAMESLGELATFRRSGALPLDLLDEVTHALPPDAWLQQLQYDGSTVAISGTAASASAVLQALSTSKYLEAAQFSAALNRTAEGKEIFRIGARLRRVSP